MSQKPTTFFFLGWPKILKLLKPFLELMRESFVLYVFDNNFDQRLLKNSIAIAYSAGARDVLRVIKENPGKIEKVFFIAPAGSFLVPNPLLVHWWRFLVEILKLSKRGEWNIFFGIINEVFLNFLKHPIRSFRKVEKIRKFDLWEELATIEKLPPCFFIFPKNDNFICYCREKARRLGVYFVDLASSGHFGVIEKPEHYKKIINQIIQVGNQMEELQKKEQ